MKAVSQKLRPVLAAVVSLTLMCAVAVTACAQIVQDSSGESSSSSSSEAASSETSSESSTSQSAASSGASSEAASSESGSSTQMAVVSASSTAQQVVTSLPTTGMSVDTRTLGGAAVTGVALILCAVVVRGHGKKHD